MNPGDREKIMAIVRDAAEIDAKKIGVRIVDVRLKRVDFDESVSTRVFDRMRSERQRCRSRIALHRCCGKRAHQG